MKKVLVVFVAVLFWPMLWAGSGDDASVVWTSGTVLTSTADNSSQWTTGSGLATSLYTHPVTTSVLTIQAAETSGKRYVSIWIIDQDENVPLNKSILYEKPMWFTDQMKDEIRAGIPLLKLLDDHNKYRETLKDKDRKALKKIRLRDLQIVIKEW